MVLLDCIFNTCIPKSTKDKVFIVRPSGGLTFANGLAYQFDESSYDQKFLGEYIKKAEFYQAIDGVNDVLISYFPCCLC